jgi:hypothetical protein
LIGAVVGLIVVIVVAVLFVTAEDPAGRICIPPAWETPICWLRAGRMFGSGRKERPSPFSSTV